MFLILLLFILLLPILSVLAGFVIARVRFSSKLRALCKKQGYRLTRGKLLSPLGRKGSRKCEYLIERERDVLSVKLIGFLSEKYILRFNSPRMVEINDLRFKGRPRADRLNDFREYLLPPYDFEYLSERPRDSSKTKKRRKGKLQRRCYVICPDVLAFSIVGGERLAGNGRKCKNVEIYSEEQFLATLEDRTDLNSLAALTL